MNLSFGLLLAVAIIYLISAFLFVLNFLRPGDRTRKRANRILTLGFFLSSFLILYQSYVTGFHLPVASLYQALSFFSWSVVLIYLLLTYRLAMDTFGLVLMPLIFLVSLSALLSYKEGITLTPYLAGKWFTVHVAAAFFAYASFALSFVGSLLYLVQNRELKIKKSGTFYHKLPSLEVLETVIYRTMIGGFPLLTVALASGFVWTREVFGVFWRWDPKFILSSLTWLLYLIILLVHYFFSFRGRRIVLISVLAFCFVLITFLGVNFFESSVHNFLK